MALDFPSSPVDGQVFGSYVWSSSIGVWKAREEQAPVTITSPTAPTSAKNGDLWFNTTNGLVFTYYDDGSSTQWVEVLSSAVPSVNEIMPVGTVTQTARITAPTGWLLCEGQNVSRTEYARLFDAIGTVYGAGNGTTTFTLPNLKGRIPVGKDSSQTEFDALGETGGAKTHTLSISEMPSHTHIQDAHNHTMGTLNLYANIGDVKNGTTNLDDWAGSDGPLSATNVKVGQYWSGSMGTTAATNQNTGGGGSHNNLQPYIVLNYMIKV